MFCERYLATGHHVEVQVMADAHGTVWAVGERECSIQRRHQKIIEEAPSPLVERTPGMRAKLFDAARLAAERDRLHRRGHRRVPGRRATGDFFFLEMNTRLQVEHPVTEETTGLDLVELQLRVADGGRLDPEPPAAQGHSIEARLYAEDPAKDWQPQAGTVHRFDVPRREREFSTLGARRASGWTPASSTARWCRSTTTRCWPRSSRTPRPGVRPRGVLADALARTRMHGVRTNRDLLVNVLRHPAFLDGATDTAFFDTHGLAELAAPLADARRASACPRSPPRSPMRPHNRRTATVFARRCPAVGATCASGYQTKTYADAAGDEHTRSATGSPAAGVDAAGSRRRARWCRRHPRRVVLSVDGVDRTVRRGPLRQTTVFVDSAAGPGAPRRAAPLPGPGSTPSRRARCWRPMPGIGDPASAQRSATPSRPGSR